MESAPSAGLSAVLTTLAVPVAVFADDGGLLVANAPWRELVAARLGVGAETTFGGLVRAIAAASDAAVSESDPAASLSAASPLDVELDSGAMLRLRVDRTDDGLVVCHLEDVTEQSRRDRLFDEFEVLVDGGAWTYDLTTGEIAFSEGIWKMLGPEAKAAMGTIDTWLAHTDPDDLPELSQKIQHSLTHLEPYEAEYRIHPPGGPSRIIHARGDVVENRHGAATLAVGVFRDVTASREQEAALRRSEGRSNAVLDSMGDMVATFDTEGAFRFLNRAGADMLGVDPDAVSSLRVAELVHPDDVPLAIDRIAWTVAHPGEFTEVDIRVRRSTGETRTLHVSGRYLPDTPGIEAILITGRDVTELREVQAQLYQAQKVEALGKLTAGVAHDFNNVLTAILGNAELLSMSPRIDAENANLAEEIGRAATHAAELTRRLLTVARQDRTTDERIDLGAVCEAVTSVLMRSIDRRVEVRVELPEDPALIMGDPAQLQGALLNLGINAVDAMPDGGVVTFSIEHLDVDELMAAALDCEVGPFVRVRVTDTGAGIDDVVREQIFDPFFTTKEEGTGLGLVAVSTCAASHRGAITLDSELGVGTTFDLFLSAAEVAGHESVAADEPVVERPVGLHVLVIDDEPVIAKYCCSALEKLGHSAESIDDPDAALDRLTDPASDIDLIILDLNMPRRNGRQVLRDIRERSPSTRVLISSGYADADTRHQLLSEGAVGFLPKPYRVGQLADAVVRASGAV